MEPTDQTQQQGDNWLSGATIEADTDAFTPEPLMLALNDVGLAEHDLAGAESDGTAIA